MTSSSTGVDIVGQADAGSILVACTANLMRSPLTAALLRQEMARAGREEIVVTSAGTKAEPGTANVPAVLRIAAEYGLDISEHQPTELTRNLVARADLVLTMTEDQRSAVVRQCPGAVLRTFTLLELRRLTDGLDAGGLHPAQLAATAHRRRPTTAPPTTAEDIEDPVGRSLRHLLRVAQELRSAVDAIAPLLAKDDRQPVRG